MAFKNNGQKSNNCPGVVYIMSYFSDSLGTDLVHNGTIRV
jgi:hypothetical protein